MNSECNAAQLELQGLGSRRVVAEYNASHVSSDGGALLLRETDERLGVVERLAGNFTDYRDSELIGHALPSLLRQRIYGIALGCEDLNYHNDLCEDSLLAGASGREDVLGEGGDVSRIRVRAAWLLGIP